MTRSSSRRRPIRLLLMALAAVALLAAACGDDSGDDADPTTTPPADETPTSSTTTAPPTTAPIPETGAALDSLQLSVVEFGDAGYVEIVNTGAEAVPLTGVNFCQFPTYGELSAIAGVDTLDAGATLQVPAAEWGGLDAASGEAALYDGNDFGSSDAMLSYVQWGTGDHERASVAADAGLWPAADVFVTPSDEFNSIESGGFAADPESWS